MVSFSIIPVFGEPEEGEEGEEDEDSQPTNICIHIIDRGGITQQFPPLVHGAVNAAD